MLKTDVDQFLRKFFIFQKIYYKGPKMAWIVWHLCVRSFSQ